MTRRSEEQARSNDERFRELTDSLPQLVWTCDGEGRCDYVSRQWLSYTGKSEESQLGYGWLELVHEDDRAAVMRKWAEAVQTTAPLVVEFRLRRHDGEYRWFDTRATPLFGDDGQIVKWVGSNTDITQRREAGDALSDRTASKRTEAALNVSEERLRIANEAAGIGTFDADLVTGRTQLSTEMCEILGLPPGTSLPLAETFDLVHSEDRDSFERALADAANPDNDGRTRLELRILRPDREIRWVSWSGKTFFEQRPEGQVPVRTVGACVDFTDRRRAERRLAMQNGVSRALADASTLGEASPKIMQALCETEGWDLGAIWQVDAHGLRLRCAELWHEDRCTINELADTTRVLEFEHGSGLPGRVWALKAPIFIPDVAREPSYVRAPMVLRAGLQSALAFPIFERDEVTGVIDFIGPPMGRHAALPLDLFTLVGRQVGLFFERKRSEAERERLSLRVRQSQKMDAIGRLSGGIAHDFNNILSALVGNTQLAQSMVSPSDPISELLAEMATANRRAVDLVKQIQAFARQQPLERRVISLTLLVEESARLLRATLPAGIELVVSTATGVPSILADPAQVHQVVFNLATNALHAIEHDSGRIELSLDSVELYADNSRTLTEVRPGRYVRLTVRDDGKGMDALTIERIFEPFFTAKATGQGTGLGLSVVHGIMQDHEGTIQVTSTVGKGTELILYFPAAADAEASASSVSVAPPSGRGEHVLYVDDEEALVKVVERGLVELGYRVSTFTRPGRALDAFRSTPQGFSVVISDMNMPGISGLSFIEQVQAIRADVPTILISGYVPETLKARAAELGVRRLLYKPCSLDELGEAVHGALRG